MSAANANTTFSISDVEVNRLVWIDLEVRYIR